jgi:hypothetical protein
MWDHPSLPSTFPPKPLSSISNLFHAWIRVFYEIRAFPIPTTHTPSCRWSSIRADSRRLTSWRYRVRHVTRVGCSLPH